MAQALVIVMRRGSLRAAEELTGHTYETIGRGGRWEGGGGGGVCAGAGGGPLPSPPGLGGQEGGGGGGGGRVEGRSHGPAPPGWGRRGRAGLPRRVDPAGAPALPHRSAWSS